MSPFAIAAILISMAAGFSYLNYRALKLPTTIGVMLIALVASLVLIGLGEFSPRAQPIQERAAHLLQRIDFHSLLLEGMLCCLLFAGALHIELGDLARHKGAVTVLATV